MNDNYNIASNTSSYDAAVTFDGYAYCLSNTIEACNDLEGSGYSLMANLQLDTASAVPEPSVFAIMVLSLFGLRLSRKK